MIPPSWRTTGLRWMRFNIVGAIGIGVQLIVLAVLKSGMHLDYLVATGFAVEAAVIHNFLWHERFTWVDRLLKPGFGRFLKFNLTTGALSILGNVAMMKLLAGMAGLNYLLANLITIAVCSVLNFVLSDTFVFAAIGPPCAPTEADTASGSAPLCRNSSAPSVSASAGTVCGFMGTDRL
jgi:putative flippase GtrA